MNRRGFAAGSFAVLATSFLPGPAKAQSSPASGLPLPGPVMKPEGVMRLQEDVQNIFSNLLAHEAILIDRADPDANRLAWGVYDFATTFLNDTFDAESLTTTLGVTRFANAMDMAIGHLRDFFLYAPPQEDPTGIHATMQEKLTRIAEEWDMAKHTEIPPLYRQAQIGENDQMDYQRQRKFRQGLGELRKKLNEKHSPPFYDI